MFFQHPDEEVDECWAALMNLGDKLMESPADRQRLLQVRVDFTPEGLAVGHQQVF